MTRKILGLVLTPEGDLVKTALEVKGRTLRSKKERLGWVQETDPLVLAAARRGQQRRMVMVTGEHKTPLRPPWMDPTAPSPEQKARLKELHRLSESELLKKDGQRADILLVVYILLLAGAGLLFTLVTVASLNIGGFVADLLS